MNKNKKTLEIDHYYQTSSLALSAAISLWYPIETIDKTNPHKATFLFKRDEKFDELLEAYWRQELKVEPQIYFNQLKTIKARLYSEE